MRKQIRFQDDMEALASDENQMQDYVQQWGDSLVRDWLLNGKAYSGLQITRDHATQVTVGPGRLYDAGWQFGVDISTALDVQPYLPAVGHVWLAVVAHGQVSTQVPVVRNFLINVETGAQQPRNVDLEEWREVILGIYAGAEAPTPVKPTITGAYTVIGWLYVGPTGIASAADVTMETKTEVANLTDAFAQLLSLSVWRGRVNQDILGLRGQVAVIMALLNSLAPKGLLLEVAADVGRIKEVFNLPQLRTDTAADRFLTLDSSWIAWTGYDAKVQEGIRFNDANSDSIVPARLNPVDPNVFVSPAGLMLPLFDEAVIIAIGDQTAERDSELRIAQYGTATFGGYQLSPARARERYGEGYMPSVGAGWWHQGDYDPATGVFKKVGETLETTNTSAEDARGKHGMMRAKRYFLDYWAEPFWNYVVTPRTVTGKMIAQTFQLSGTFWATSVELYINALGAAGDITVMICETDEGKPDFNRIVSYVTVVRADLTTGFCKFPIEPTFLTAGIRYAICVVTVGDHYFAISTNNDYKSGTFFFAADDDYLVVAANQDLCFKLNIAQFRYLQTIVEFEPWNLAGGLNNVDIMMVGMFPGLAGPGHAHRFNWEYRIGSVWYPIVPPVAGSNVATPLSNLPALVPVRARVTNDKHVAPGVRLSASAVGLSRPKLTMRHVSTLRTLAASSTYLDVTSDIANWNALQHTITCKLYHGVTTANTGTVLNPASVTDIALPAGRIRRKWHFILPAPGVYAYVVQFDATATSANNTPVIEERVDVAY